MTCERNISIICISRDEKPVTTKSLVLEIEDRCQSPVGGLEALLGQVNLRTASQLCLLWTSERYMESRIVVRRLSLDFIKLIMARRTLNRDEHSGC